MYKRMPIKSRVVKSTSKIQLGDDTDRSGNRIRGGRRSEEDETTSISDSAKGSGKGSDDSGRKSVEKFGAWEHIKIKLGDLKRSLSKDVLLDLLKDEHDPDEIITIRYFKIITKKKDSIYEERFTPTITPRKTVVAVNKSTEEIYEILYNKYLDGKIKADSKVVLGCYLVNYRKFFNEGEPDISSKKSVRTELFYISKFAKDVSEKNYDIIVQYIESLLPLWAKRLTEEQSFPNTRPNFRALFVKKHFWANRKVYYRQWKL
jgi:hypothetical protein